MSLACTHKLVPAYFIVSIGRVISHLRCNEPLCRLYDRSQSGLGVRLKVKVNSKAQGEG